MKGKAIEVSGSSKGKGEPVIIKVYPDMCKACEICVEYCPQNVLEMNGFIVEVKRINECTKCMRCEIICPDFAITVE